MNGRIRVTHYYTYPENSGGPLTYIRNVVSSGCFTDVVFSEVYQQAPITKLGVKGFSRIVSQIKAFAPDILHIHGVQSEGLVGLLAGKAAKVPVLLLTVHGMQQDAQNIGRAKKLLFAKIIEPYVLGQADAVYCVCDAMTNRGYIQKYAKNLKETIHCFYPRPALNEIERVPHSGITYIYVGRVSKDKGMEELEACILSDEDENHRYIIVGSGEYEVQMRQNLSGKMESGAVQMLGQRGDVEELLKKADVFIFPSHHENLSIALLEACNAGLACIVTDVGGNTEVIRDGYNGRVVCANDAEGLLRTVREMSAQGIAGIRAMGENANRTVRERFAADVICKQINSLYHDLAKR